MEAMIVPRPPKLVPTISVGILPVKPESRIAAGLLMCENLYILYIHYPTVPVHFRQKDIISLQLFPHRFGWAANYPSQ